MWYEKVTREEPRLDATYHVEGSTTTENIIESSDCFRPACGAFLTKLLRVSLSNRHRQWGVTLNEGFFLLLSSSSGFDVCKQNRRLQTMWLQGDAEVGLKFLYESSMLVWRMNFLLVWVCFSHEDFFCIFKDVDLDGKFQNILIRLWAFLSFWERYIDVKDFAWKDKFVVRYRNWGFLMFILALF